MTPFESLAFSAQWESYKDIIVSNDEADQSFATAHCIDRYHSAHNARRHGRHLN